MIHKFVAVMEVTEHVYVDFNIDVAADHRIVAQEKASKAAEVIADKMGFDYVYVTGRNE
jgi:hypothetical protein